MKTLITLAALLILQGCVNRPLSTPTVADALRKDLADTRPPLPVPAAVSQALAEPAPAAPVNLPEPRLDLLVNKAQAREVFLAIVADTRYSMLMHPDVSGTVSVTLRGVTVREALDAIRDVYGYDYKMEGRRITVYAPTLQTRIFTVNYPNAQRVGRSELRVASGSANMTPNTPGVVPGVTSPGVPNANRAGEGSRVTTNSSTDLWTELAEAIRSMLGNGQGRSVITSPQAGIIAVRAMPDELRQIEGFLKAAQVAVERQVMLEAKIVEVELRDGYQSGINWAAFNNDGKANQQLIGTLGSGVSNTNPLLQGGSAVAPVTPVPSVAVGGGLFGLALATGQFGAVLGFLETQGDVQTLSSPRVATLNNQKAVLKVGSDDYFVTNVTGGAATSGGALGNVATTTTLPNLTLTPFFSGVALDVTPQIDDSTNIMLHIHPAVTTVTENIKTIDLGSGVGTYKLPLASSSVNETDTLVRVQDGNIVAIGGLMQVSSSRTASGLPGSTGASNALGFLLGNRANSGRKKELVVLVKPTIIRSAQDWEAQTARSLAAINDLVEVKSRTVRLDGAMN
jgi:MSHA biogenesis protein MshL